jgi:tRNA-specific 2-thiouridylase
MLRDVNWLGDGTLKELEHVGPNGVSIYARVRSSQPPRPATLFVEPGGEVHVVLTEAENGVAAGQACVFYSDASPRSRILGGGLVMKALLPALAARQGGLSATTVKTMVSATN